MATKRRTTARYSRFETRIYSWGAMTLLNAHRLIQPKLKTAEIRKLAIASSDHISRGKPELVDPDQFAMAVIDEAHRIIHAGDPPPPSCV